MSGKSTENKDEGRRCCMRVWGKLRGRLFLGGKDGQQVVIAGVTRDVCLKGLFLTSVMPLDEVALDAQGIIELGGFADKRTIPIRAVHWNRNGVGVELQTSPAEVGGALSRLLFGEGQTRLGAELTADDHISVRIKIDGGDSFDTNLQKINTGHLECSLTTPGKPPLVGAGVSIEIKHAGNEASIRCDGVIRTVSASPIADDDRNLDVKISVIFSMLDDAAKAQIRVLVDALYKKRIDSILKESACKYSLFAKGDDPTPVRDRREIENQLTKFFGNRSGLVRRVKFD